MKITIPDLLTFNGGYVDAAGFVALQGLFTAHVTGNFVTIGASLVQGTSGIVAKLLALPVFCLIVLLTRYASQRYVRSGGNVTRTLLAIKLLLLVVAAALACWWGPFPLGDHLPAIVTGMVLVAAMAIQNVIHRVYFPKAPPTTLMTGSTTQVMIDLADLWRGGLAPDAREAIKARSAAMARSVGIFAVGCALAALAYAGFGERAFVVPPMIAALTLLPRFQRSAA
ncbi:YoaK family protein [Lysobacter sp. P5_B9]